MWGLTEALDAAAARLRLADDRRQQSRLALSRTDTLSPRSRHGARITAQCGISRKHLWIQTEMRRFGSGAHGANGADDAHELPLVGGEVHFAQRARALLRPGELAAHDRHVT